MTFNQDNKDKKINRVNLFKDLEKHQKEQQKMINELKELQQSLTHSLGDIEAILPGEVKEWGTSAHIPFLKRFAGKKVKIIILKDQEEDQPKQS